MQSSDVDKLGKVDDDDDGVRKDDDTGQLKCSDAGLLCPGISDAVSTQKEAKAAAPGRRQKATSGDKGAKKARVAPKGKRSQGSSCRAVDSCAILNWSSLSMYFSYVPSIIFSFFNRPLFLNLLFK